MIESARLHKMGFPECMSNVEFVRRFGLLAGDSTGGTDNLENILANNDIDPSVYRIGPSQVSEYFWGYKNIKISLNALS